ncbi:MAG: hypothetical protein U9O89_02785 [Thermoproteota archaeon]|nr:hypothetical protein [Thermoproteota archaeon]
MSRKKWEIEQMKMSRGEFNQFLLQVIDYNLKQIFGKTATEIIYNYLERKHSLIREEIPENLGVFVEGLRELLSSGAQVIEHTVLTKLYSSLGLEYETKQGYTFTNYVTELRNVFKNLENPLIK